jgi:hypothetical protein
MGLDVGVDGGLDLADDAGVPLRDPGGSGDRPVDVAVAVGQVTVEILAAEHDLEAAGVPDQRAEPVLGIATGRAVKPASIWPRIAL